MEEISGQYRLTLCLFIEEEQGKKGKAFGA
jgi:hypothetical protein